MSERYTGIKAGQPVIRLEDKHGRFGVLIHEGSQIEWLEGCIGIGSNMPSWGKTEAGVGTKNEMLQYIETIIQADQERNEETTIEVEVIDHIEEKEESQ